MDKSKIDSLLKGFVSRRGFFKGSAIIAGGLATAGILGGAKQVEAQSVDRTTCAPNSWEQTAKPILAGDIKNTVNTDVLIIGAGLAGVIAAISAKEAGAGDVTIIDKNRTHAFRGLHIGAFGSKTQEKYGLTANYRQVIREWIRWAQGRVNENLLWLWSHKSGACMDWLVDHVEKKGVKVDIWSQYYKGPDYTEYPVTHIFYDPKTNIRGNGVLLKAIEEIARDKGVKFVFQTKAQEVVRDNKGKATAVIAGNAGNYTKYTAQKGIIIATGDYASNKEMVGRYAPIANMADAQIYFPNKCNTGDGHAMAMRVGGAMQKTEPHAAVIHLEAGAMSYGFLHVNALGKRFKNEDVNTQSKSCSKLFEPKGIAWTVYDADGLTQVQEQIDRGVAGGLFYGQMDRFIGEKWQIEDERQLLEAHVKSGKVVTANTIEELAAKMDIPVKELRATVDKYNKAAAQKDDTEYGKRPELLRPIAKAPFYAGKLMATVLTMSGGLRTDTSLRVLDTNDKPIENLYVIGAAAGDFFAADYPTIVPGIGHGRCVTFGRLVGLAVAGKSYDEVPSIII